MCIRDRQYWFDWNSKKASFQHTVYNNKHYYYVSDLSVIQNKVYNFKWQYDIPINSQGKWELLGKLHSDTIQEALSSGHYILLDPWWDTDWDYKKKITIDHTLVNCTLTNFPVLINISSDADLVAHVDQANGEDIAFTNAAEDTQFNHEIEYWDSATGQLVVWVNVTTLSHAADTVIYMYYGNATCADQQDITGTWDINYSGVWHMKDQLDSTSNDNDFSNSGADLITGNIDGSYDFVSANSDYINMGDISSELYTLQIWFKADEYIDKNVAAQEFVAVDTTNFMGLYFGDTTGLLTDEVFIILDANTNDRTGICGALTISNTTYHLASISWNSTTTKYDMYIDGVKYATTDSATGGNVSRMDANKFLMATDQLATFMDVIIDDARFSDISRNCSWINTTCNNFRYASDGGFFTLGIETKTLNVVTTAVTNIGYTRATLNAIIDGGTNATCGFWIGNSTTSSSSFWYNHTLTNPCYYNATESFSNLTVGLTSGQKFYVRAWSNDTTSFEESSTEVTFTTYPDPPTGLTATDYNDSSITLTWTKGYNDTVIIRNTTDPNNATDGTQVYNGSAETYIDTGLIGGTRYYYRAYNWNSTWAYSALNSSTNQYTKPQPPQDVISKTIGVGGDSINLNISWVNGSGSNVTLVRRSATSQPLLITDGTLVSNSSLNFTIDTGITTVYYYTLWSYDNITGYYSSAVYVTDFYVVWINCYNESGGENISSYGVFFTNQAGTQTYADSTCTNPHIVNTSDIPTGTDIALQVNATGYDTRVYYFDITATGIQYIDVYLSLTNTSDNYVITIENVVGNPIPDAKIIVRRYINESVGYENVTIDYADGYGQISITLVIDALYKFDISADGYENLTGQNWQPVAIVFVDDRYKTFQLLFEETPVHPPYIPQDYITFTANRTNTSTIILYDDSLLETIDTTIYIYEIDLLTGNETLFQTNTSTDTDSFIVTAIGLEANNSYRIVLRYNHTTFGYQTLTLLLPGYRRTVESGFDTFMVNIFGYNPFLWSNIIMVLIFIAVMYSADKQDMGKYLILLGGIFVFITVFIGFGDTIATAAGGILPAMFVLIGILMEWKKGKGG